MNSSREDARREAAAHQNSSAPYRLLSFVVNAGSAISATANVCISLNGDALETVAFGSGPIDAAFHAVENVVQSGATLINYTIRALAGGNDAQGEVTVTVCSEQGRQITATGVSGDIIEASIKAYVAAMNRLYVLDHPASK